MQNIMLNGNDRQWELISKISEGDAGEVYLVKSIRENKTGILKRPTTNPFDKDRQSEQIKSEKEILDALGVIYNSQKTNEKSVIRPVELFDYGYDDEGRFFIVMDKAIGFSLSTLYKLSKNEISVSDLLGYSQVEQHFADHISKTKRVPEYLILRVLLNLLNFLEEIHSLQSLRGDHSGVVWNDVKPDHIFWNPVSQQITVIDWGNAQFLNQGGLAQNGNLDKDADIFQYVDAMGKHVRMVAPDLAKRLGWATSVLSTKDAIQAVPLLRKGFPRELKEYQQQRQECRGRENEICQSTDSFDLLPELVSVHECILYLGECPNYVESRKYGSELIGQLSRQQDLEDCKIILDSKTLFYEDIEQQQIIEELIFNVTPQRPIYFSRAIELAANEFASPQDWEDVFWNIHLAFIGNANALRSKNRLLKALAVKLNKQVESILESVLYNKLVELKDKLESKKRRSRTDNLSKAIKELGSVIDEWKFQEAGEGKTLDFNIGYDSVREFVIILTNLGEGDCVKEVNEISKYVSELDRNVELVRSAWIKKDFSKAKEELRTLHKWDPERLRVFTADRLLAKASLWVAQTSSNDKSISYENLLEEGKGFRYFFGKAEWLDERIRQLETRLTPDKSTLIKVGKFRKGKPNIIATIPTNLPSGTIFAAGDTAGTNLATIKPSGNFDTPSPKYESSATVLEKFLFFLRECNWENAKKMLDDGYFRDTETVDYRKIVETLKRIKSCKDFSVDWNDFIDRLKKEISHEHFAGEIADAWLVVESLQKKEWKQPEGIDVKRYETTIKAIGILRDFSNLHWKNKLLQTNTKLINNLIENLKGSNQSVSEKVFSLYLTSVASKVINYVGDIKQALDKFNKSRNRETAYSLLDAVKNLESLLIADPKQSNKWLQEYDSVVNQNKPIDVDKENPVFYFLKPKEQSSIWGSVKNFMVAGLVIGCILVLFLVGKADFSWGGRFFPVGSDAPRSTRTPKKETSDTSEPNPPVDIATSSPTMTFTLQTPELEFDCDKARFYVKEGLWVEYMGVLAALPNDQYENARRECGWSQDYYQRKLDVELRNIQSLPSEKIFDAKVKLVDGLEQIGWVKTEKYINEASDTDLLGRTQRLRGILASCNAVPVRIPVNNTARLIEELTENYFTPDMEGVFRELCQQDYRQFLQTTISPQDRGADGNLDLLSTAPPYDSKFDLCFYNDQSVTQGIHYNGATDNCLIRVVEKKVDFIDFSMCIYDLKPTDTFFYGMKVSHPDVTYALMLENENGISSVWPEPGIAVLDPEGTFGTAEISCEEYLDVQAIVLGNLLMWRYRSDREFAYVKEAQVFDDELIQEPFNISLFGYVKDDPKKLHFYIEKFDVMQGAPR